VARGRLVFGRRGIQRGRRPFGRRWRWRELVKDLTRIVRHLLTPHWFVYRAFPQRALKRFERAIAESEKAHSGEIRFAAEAGLDLLPLLQGVTPRGRAHEIFARLRVWDTEHNSGVLIYVQVVDRKIEIVADRGISAKVDQRQWNEICGRIEQAFRERRFEEGAMEGIREVGVLLARHFPASPLNPDELPDKPVVL